MTQTAHELPDFPYERDGRCPFNPSPGLYGLRERGAVAKVRLWTGNEAWVVTGYQDQRELLSDDRLSSRVDAEQFPFAMPSMKVGTQNAKLLLNMDNPEHDAFRRIIARDFIIRKIEALRPGIQGYVDSLIDAMLAGPKPVDLVTAFSLAVPSLVIADLLGVPYDDHDYFQSKSAIICASGATEAEAIAAQNELLDYVGSLADAKLLEPKDDVISHLAASWAAGDVTRDALIGGAFALLSGGHETTANLISLATIALLQRPDQLEAIRNAEDPQFIANAVEELLRYIHVTHSGLRRTATRDFEVAGQLIRQGDGVILPGNLANRDPSAFDGDVDELDVTRPARQHVAFGYGIHQCLGQPLVRAEMQIVLSTLYRRIPTLSLAVESKDINWKQGNFFGVNELPVTW